MIISEDGKVYFIGEDQAKVVVTDIFYVVFKLLYPEEKQALALTCQHFNAVFKNSVRSELTDDFKKSLSRSNISMLDGFNLSTLDHHLTELSLKDFHAVAHSFKNRFSNRTEKYKNLKLLGQPQIQQINDPILWSLLTWRTMRDFGDSGEKNLILNEDEVTQVKKVFACLYSIFELVQDRSIHGNLNSAQSDSNIINKFEDLKVELTHSVKWIHDFFNNRLPSVQWAHDFFINMRRYQTFLEYFELERDESVNSINLTENEIHSMVSRIQNSGKNTEFNSRLLTSYYQINKQATHDFVDLLCEREVCPFIITRLNMSLIRDPVAAVFIANNFHSTLTVVTGNGALSNIEISIHPMSSAIVNLMSFYHNRDNFLENFHEFKNLLTQYPSLNPKHYSALMLYFLWIQKPFHSLKKLFTRYLNSAVNLHDRNPQLVDWFLNHFSISVTDNYSKHGWYKHDITQLHFLLINFAYDYEIRWDQFSVDRTTLVGEKNWQQVPNLRNLCRYYNEHLLSINHEQLQFLFYLSGTKNFSLLDKKIAKNFFGPHKMVWNLLTIPGFANGLIKSTGTWSHLAVHVIHSLAHIPDFYKRIIMLASAINHLLVPASQSGTRTTWTWFELIVQLPKTLFAEVVKHLESQKNKTTTPDQLINHLLKAFPILNCFSYAAMFMPIWYHELNPNLYLLHSLFDGLDTPEFLALANTNIQHRNYDKGFNLLKFILVIFNMQSSYLDRGFLTRSPLAAAPVLDLIRIIIPNKTLAVDLIKKYKSMISICYPNLEQFSQRLVAKVNATNSPSTFFQPDKKRKAEEEAPQEQTTQTKRQRTESEEPVNNEAIGPNILSG